MTEQATTSVPTSLDRGGWDDCLLWLIRKLGPIYKLAELVTTVRVVVQGRSMEPNFTTDQLQDGPRHLDYLLVSRLALWSGDISRGDVAVLRNPSHLRQTYIKRIVGLPGDRVGTVTGRVFINDVLLEEPYLGVPLDDSDLDRLQQLISEGHIQEWSLGEEQYFVMGDNRAADTAVDSRSFGPVNRHLIVGKAWIRYWPRSAWGIVS